MVSFSTDFVTSEINAHQYVFFPAATIMKIFEFVSMPEATTKFQISTYKKKGTNKLITSATSPPKLLKG